MFFGSFSGNYHCVRIQTTFSTLFSLPLSSILFWKIMSHPDVVDSKNGVQGTPWSKLAKQSILGTD